MDYLLDYILTVAWINNRVEWINSLNLYLRAACASNNKDRQTMGRKCAAFGCRSGYKGHVKDNNQERAAGRDWRVIENSNLRVIKINPLEFL